MSSHREAPEISKDPVADNADVYAFVSTNPGEAGTVTIITNFVPLQGPAGGPNFYEFGDDVLYSIYIDNNGDAQPEIEYQFQFNSTLQYDNTFLYNIGPIAPLTLNDTDPNWNARQFYSVTRIDAGPPPKTKGPKPPQAQGGPAFPNGPTHSTVLGTNLPCPPCNIGPNSTPSYEANYGHPAVQPLPGGGMVFAGQRSDPFYVDLGAVFDLADLRPFQPEFVFGGGAVDGIDSTKQLNIHSIAIQIPISMLTQDGSTPTSLTDPNAVLGIWSAASRRKVRMFDDHKNSLVQSGPWVQVSRLGNPLFNELVVPIAQKDDWNRGNPVDDSEYLPLVQSPELSNKIANILYKPSFPNLRAYAKPRADLVAILLTGIPGLNGSTAGPPSLYADMLRLNVAVQPTTDPAKFSVLGVVFGDLAGYPNGRRVFDDVVAIDLKAFAGATIPLVDKSYTPDGAAGALSQWKEEPPPSAPLATPAADSPRYLNHFPYVGTPYDGYDIPSS